MRRALDKDKLKGIYNRVARRYDFQHGFLTARTDQLGRIIVVENTVASGDNVLDCGAGTGSTALLAAHRVGPSGKITLYDMSEGMLEVAKIRARNAKVMDRVEFRYGDMHHLPFDDNTFDAALSTYSMCPLQDPVKGALELFRVVKPGGRIGIAHSTDPKTPWVKWLAEKVEDAVWHFPPLSLGCRSVAVLPALRRSGCTIILQKHVGIPLWPFVVFVLEKPAT